MLFQTVAAEAEGLFAAKPPRPFSSEISKIDRSMPIVVETKQISDRLNSPSKSKAEISDGLGGGFDHRQEKFAAMNQRVIMIENHRVGDVPALQQQYGRNFSVSVIPYRSPPLIHTSRASLLKDMPKPWPTTSRCPRCGASYQVVRIEDGWNAETVRGLLACLWGGLSRAETDCPS